MTQRPTHSTPTHTLFPYVTLYRSLHAAGASDANDASRSQGRAGAAESETVAARNAAQLLLFRDTNARIRGVRLSVIERVEEVPVSSLFESAGRIQVQIGTDIFPVQDRKSTRLNSSH